MTKIRRLELYIGPFVDTENNNTSEALQITSTGMDNELSIAFSVEKTIASSANKGEILIENLNRETMAKFNQHNLAIEVRYGYPDSDAGVLTVHKGGVKVVNPQGNIMRLTTADGGGAIELGITNRSYSSEESLERIIRDLVSDMPNIAIGKVSVNGKIGFKGRFFNGSTRDQLNNLAHQFGFTWSIQNGVFQAFEDTATTEKTYTFTADNIEDIAPIIGTDGSQKGYSMVSYLDPRINAGDKITINSVITPQYNGTYRVDKHAMAAQSHGPDAVSHFDLGVLS